jgi:hypothetical protein
MTRSCQGSVSFMKTDAEQGIIYLLALTKFCPHFLHLHMIWIQFSTVDVHINLSSYCEFHEHCTLKAVHYLGV